MEVLLESEEQMGQKKQKGRGRVRSQKGVTQKGVLVTISELAEAKQRG